MDKINNDRKTLIDLALKAGRKRQSGQTGYVHHYHEGSDKEQHTIPVFDNFCFVLALFKSRLSENVVEGKELLKKLLKFQVESHFPVYLHEYPECRSLYLGSCIHYVLQLISLEFSGILGVDLKEALDRSMCALAKGEIAPSRIPKTPAEWGEALAFSKISFEEALDFWNPELHAYIGPSQFFERGEPAVTLFDLYMGQLFGSFSRRALEDHPIHLRAALLSPPSSGCFNTTLSMSTFCYAGTSIFWGDNEKLHSLYCHPKKADLEKIADDYLFKLSETIPDEGEDRHEIAFYATLDTSTTFFVNGKRATTFQMGDVVELVSDQVTIRFDFTLLEGEGKFFGHILRANRPAHRVTPGENPYTAYDWQLSLRTLFRTSACKLCVRVFLICNGRGECRAVDRNAHSVHSIIDVEDGSCDC
jgi:hypothetical protein